MSKQSNVNGIDTYVIRGLDANGNVKYYTGRAGAENWLDADISKAFGYQSLEVARRVATNMNRMTPIHGIHFSVPWIREYLEQSA